MLRGLRKAWKFPLMFDFDWNMTLDNMKEIIAVIEECGGRVRSCTGDMGNKTFLSQVGVTKGIYSFPNPVRPEARVHVFCDAPHLIKVCYCLLNSIFIAVSFQLLRNHTLDSGLQFKSSKYGLVTLNLSDFEQLRDNDSSDGNVAKYHKLGEDHLYCTGPCRQRVRFAVQLFSATVGNGFKMMGQDGKAWVVNTINDFFDALDSRLKYHKSNKIKCAMGINEDLQFEALKSMLHLIQNVKFGGYSKPFMKGIMCTINSLISLYMELKDEGQQYFCTYQVNQDPLELFFAQVRSLGGPNNHPRAADFCSRFRTLSMCSNSVVDNVLSPNTNITPDTESSEYSWNALGVAEEDFSNNDGLLEQDEEEELQFELPGRTDPEAVQYISGYVAQEVCCVFIV